jgi:hypothetical protein
VRVDAGEIRTVRTVEELADNMSPMIFLGCIVIRRDIWMSRRRDTYFGSQIVHIGVIFQRELSRFAIVLGEPLVTCRYGYSRWTSEVFYLQVKWFPDIVSSAPFSPVLAACDERDPQPPHSGHPDRRAGWPL